MANTSSGLSVKDKMSYAVGAVGKDMVYSLVSGFILYYYNTVLGISGTFTGVMMMAARVFDAFNDPMMGIVVEKTHTKIGKFRPWILTGTVTNSLVLFGMFSVPESYKGSSLLIWATVAYFLWGMTYTIMDIPFWSMIPAITKTGTDRENLSVIGRTASSVGYAIPTVTTMLIVTRIGGSEMLSLPILRKKWSSKSILSGAICVTIFGYIFLFLLGTFSITNVALLSLSAFIIYIGFGLATVLTTIFLADTVDYGEYKNGKRNESVIFSMQTFVVKLASAFSVLIAGVGIDLIGLDTEAAVQSPSTILGLRIIMIVIPIFGFFAALLFFRKKYMLTEEKNAEIAAELAKRNADK